jgi:hypothetical protein
MQPQRVLICILFTIIAFQHSASVRRTMEQQQRSLLQVVNPPDALSNSNGCLGSIPKCGPGACVTRDIMGVARWACLRCEGNFQPVIDGSGKTTSSSVVSLPVHSMVDDLAIKEYAPALYMPPQLPYMQILQVQGASVSANTQGSDQQFLPAELDFKGRRHYTITCPNVAWRNILCTLPMTGRLY